MGWTALGASRRHTFIRMEVPEAETRLDVISLAMVDRFEPCCSLCPPANLASPPFALFMAPVSFYTHRGGV